MGDNVNDHGAVPLTAVHATAFLQNRGSDLHPALDTEQKTLREKFPQTSIPSLKALDTDLYTEDFKKVIRAYAQAQDDPKVQALVNYQDEHGWKNSSWDEVFQKFKLAEAEYLKTEDRPFRKLGRKLNDHASSVLPFLRMIPNDMHWAVLSGGMRLIVEAAVRLGKKREEILASIIRIPCVIIKADSYTQTFGHDAFVIAQAEVVYVNALVVMQGILEWLTAGPKGKPFKALLRGPLYNQKFDEKILLLNQSLDALEIHAEGARDRTLGRVDTGIGGLQRSMTDFSAMQHESQNHMHMINGAIHDLSTAKEDKDAEAAKHLLEASKEAIEHLKRVLGDTNSTAKWMEKRDHDWKKLTARVRDLERAGVALTLDDVLEIVDVGRTTSLFDIRKVLNAVPEPQESIAAVGAAQNPVFKEWQEDDCSSALFMEQATGSFSSRYVSSMSILSSNLVSSLENNTRATCIHFFCGLHTSAGDKLAGPSGAVRSLLEQVLRMFPVQLDFFSLRLKQQLEMLNFRALCECFSRIIRSLPLTTILFCVVDSVNFLDKAIWIDDLRHFLEVLLNLTEDANMSAIFKVLVTSPVRTRQARDIFPSELRLTINTEFGSRGGLTERELAEASRRSRRMPQRALRAALQPGIRSENASDEEWFD